jgi:hypothetical protein
VAHVRRDHHHRRRRVVHRPTLERDETVKRQDIYDAIGHERDRQARLWSASHAWGEGDCSSPTLPPIVKSAVLAEECGEVARAVLEHDAHNLPRELIQVAAVAVAWLESM